MKTNIVLLSEVSYPYGFAGSTKNRILTNALVNAGADVQVLVIRPWDKRNLPKGSFGNIEYRYIMRHGLLHYEDCKFFRVPILNEILTKIFNRINSFVYAFVKHVSLIKSIFYLINLNKRKKIDVLLIYTLRFSDIFYMRIASKLIKKPLVFFIVEDYLTFKFNSAFKRFAASLYMKKSIYFIDGILPISKFLFEKIKEFEKRRKKSLPKLIIPILYENKNMYAPVENEKKPYDKYFLFNSTRGYLEDAVFVIQAFAKTNKNVRDNFKLVLIIGDIAAKQRLMLTNLAESNNVGDQVIIKGYLPEMEFRVYYKMAAALLIPLPDTDKSRARFSQKVANFLLTGNPIITTNIGEMQYYFKDNKNALVTASYNLEEYSEKMNYICEHPEYSETIGRKGKESCLKYFDSLEHAKDLLRFIEDNIQQ